jgi:RNA polymerase sigma-70 factor (ECF subfamily)
MTVAINTTPPPIEPDSDVPCGDAWRDFHDRCAPLIRHVTRRLGLSREDAADVGQETWTRFWLACRAGRYDRRRGGLRTWLVAMVRYRVADLHRARAANRELTRDPDELDLVAPTPLVDPWDVEHERRLLRQALQELLEASRFSDRTLRAFERFVLQQHPASRVAAELGLTPHDVYMAKNRVTKRLRGIMSAIEVGGGSED